MNLWRYFNTDIGDWFYHYPDGKFIPPRHMVIKNKIMQLQDYKNC